MKKFDESKCKRDKDGQFAKKDTLTNQENDDTIDEEKSFEEIERETFPHKAKEYYLKQMPKRAFGFAKDRLHTKDHERHVKEMGFKTSKEYERAAIDFWENSDGDLYYSKRRQSYYKYDKKRKWFLSLAKDGTVRTFHKLSEKNFKNRKEQDECLNLEE